LLQFWLPIYFDKVTSALEQARLYAGEGDIHIAGGANVIQQYLNAGVVDELEIALAPVLFGSGRCLFENIGETPPAFKSDRVLDTPQATHLRYVRVQYVAQVAVVSSRHQACIVISPASPASGRRKPAPAGR
jgi:dihydrofolate reductase